MKKIFNKILAFIIITALLYSCAKYEDGPSFSLKSKNKRLLKKWVMTEYTNYHDGLFLFNFADTIDRSFIKFEEDGVFETSQTNNIIAGEWQWNDDKSCILTKLSTNIENVWDTNTVLRLSSDDLWLREFDDTGGYDEFHYEFYEDNDEYDD